MHYDYLSFEAATAADEHSISMPEKRSKCKLKLVDNIIGCAIIITTWVLLDTLCIALAL